jgi:hypothetical protein
MEKSELLMQILTQKVCAGWGSVNVMTANRVEPGVRDGWVKRKDIQNKAREEYIKVKVSK